MRADDPLVRRPRAVIAVDMPTPAARGQAAMTEREPAWSLFLDRLPPAWRTAQPSHEPGPGRWEAVAIGPTVGGRRGGPPATLIGVGTTELEALRDLVAKLIQRP